LLSYRKLGGYKTGMFVNFNVPHLKDGIKRVVNDFLRFSFALLRVLGG